MTRRSGRSARMAGFTLLEALMALALMAAILGSLATITAQWLPNWNRGFASVQRSELVALGLERLAEDLAAAQPVTVRGERGELAFDGAELSVLFVRPAAGPNSVGLELVRIAETTGERGVMLIRTRAPFVPANEDVLASLRPNFSDPVVLLRAPYRVSFAYAGADRVWRETWRGVPQLPRAIRLTVRDAGTGRRLAISTAVDVRAELPAECARFPAVAACPALQPPGAAAQAGGAGGSAPR